jgi:hypothetical protein
MKTTPFLLTASMALAIAFTFSCSSGEDESDGNKGNSSSSSVNNGGAGNVDMSGLPKQLYVDGEEYKGNGDIVLIFDSDTLHAGKIENGLITLELPENMDDKYFDTFSKECPYNCENVSYPRDLTITGGYLHAFISDKNLCHIELNYDEHGEDDASITFISFSESGEIKGTVVDEYNEMTFTYTYDMNFSKGWNFFYGYCKRNDRGYCIEIKLSTDSEIIKGLGEPKWQADCDID